MLILLMLYII